MSEKVNPNAPAFPTQDTIHPVTEQRFEPLNIGLTKREYFAAMRNEPLSGSDTLSLEWAKLIMQSEPPTGTGLGNMQWWITAHEKFSLMRADTLIAELSK